MTYDDIQQKISDDFAQMNDRHRAEKQALRDSHIALWATYSAEKSEAKRLAGLARVVSHNAAVRDASKGVSDERKAEKAAERQQRVVVKLRAKHVLTGETAAEMIDELEGRIASKLPHVNGADGDSNKSEIQKMRQSIVALGGVPIGVATAGSIQAEAPLTDGEMDKLLDEPEQPTE